MKSGRAPITVFILAVLLSSWLIGQDSVAIGKSPEQLTSQDSIAVGKMPSQLSRQNSMMSPVIELVFTGDIMLGRAVQTHSVDGWQQVFADITPILQAADLTLANLESPLTTAPLQGTQLDLRARPDAVEALVQAGIDFVSLANNHALDAGTAGLEETRQTLAANHIQHAGPELAIWHTQAGDEHLCVITVNMLQSGFQLEQVFATIAAECTADCFCTISIHWGHEFQRLPAPLQRDFAHACADAGVDLIAGHHPHVLQPIEWIWGDGQRHPMLVAYSLGNTIFDQTAPPGTRQGLLLRVFLQDNQLRSAETVSYSIYPGTWQAYDVQPPEPIPFTH